MPKTIDQYIRQAVIGIADSPTPRLDAEVLAMHVTGLTRAQLITRADNELTLEQESTLNVLVARRARGEPVAYLTGKREFWSMELHVTPDVLIPRPETELLVEQALARIPLDSAWTIADLGTGSGAIALAIAKERPRCRVIATDASQAALNIARGNATRLGISNIEFRHGEWLAPLAGLQFDLIVSNPPYVAADDLHLPQGDVRYEPQTALVSGHDGLDAIRTITTSAHTHLKPGGWLLLEHSHDQGAAVASLLERQHFVEFVTLPDFAGQERVSLGRTLDTSNVVRKP